MNLQIAVGKFSEATVGYRENKEVAERWVRLFSTPYFQVSAVSVIYFLFNIGLIISYNPNHKCNL